MRNATIACFLGLGLTLASLGAPAAAQDAPGVARPHRRAPLRIKVTPSPRYYRQCVDRYVVEPRATGPTVVPRTQCRWSLRP
jgi:hypothetical protein